MWWVGCAALLSAACVTKASKNQEPGPALKSVERYGDYLPARTAAVLPGKTKPLTLFGQVGVVVEEPEFLGFKDTRYKTPEGYIIAAGLQILDTSSGKIRRLTSADGLPTMRYQASDGADAGEGTVPFFDLAWIDPDTSFAAATWKGVVRGEVDSKDQWSFKEAVLKAPGAEENAQVTFIALADGSLYAGSNQGVAELDPNTLAVKRWMDLGASCKWIYGLASGHVNGPAVAVACSAPDKGAPSDVRLIMAGESTAKAVVLPDGVKPTMVAGLPSAMLVGGRESDGRGVLYRLEEDIEHNLQLNVVADADELNHDAIEGKPFVPFRAAYDDVHGKLLVGGLIPSRAPNSVGGVMTFSASPTGEITDHGEHLFDRPDSYFAMLPWEVNVLEVDSAGRWYVGGRQLCNESKAKNVGVLRIEVDGKEKRVVRPFVSGVRTIAIEPVTQQVWLGLRDESPAWTCDGFNVQQHVCRLKADGSCEVYAPNVNASGNLFASNPGASAIAFGDVKRKEFAIATRRDATFVRRGDVADAVDTQINPKVSLWQTAAAWDEKGALWLGSEMPTDAALPNDDGSIDIDKVNDRSPHGLGYIEFGDGVTRANVLRYVRRASDLDTIDRGGMPSNTVWDVMPLGGSKHALVALGIERLRRAYEHQTPEMSQYQVKGGIAEVNGDSISVIAPPAGVTWGDVVALAKSRDGSFFALDADAGVFTLDLANRTSKLWAEAKWKGAGRGRGLAIDSSGNVAVATTNGLYLYDSNANVTVVSEDGTQGEFWSVRFTAPGVLLAGADQGLLRVAVAGATPTALGPTGLLPREPWELSVGCEGADGCECHGDDMCQYGNRCLCISLDDCVCGVPKPPDPCIKDPGSMGCACKVDEECAESLTCGCEGDTCVCKEPPPTCDGTTGCPCQKDVDCADGYFCRSSLFGWSCSPKQ
jgi:hypothetical protein